MSRPSARTGAGHGAMATQRLANRQTGDTACYCERGDLGDDVLYSDDEARCAPRGGCLT